MPLPAAVAAFGPSILAGVGNLAGGMLQNSANRAMSREQMAFQERMSGSAYQRAVADMKLAGINPMLAAGSGGASSPGGASAQMENVISPAVASAQHATRLRQELLNMKTDRATSMAHGYAATQAGLKDIDEREHIKAMTAKENAETAMISSGLQEARNREAAAGTKFGRVLTQIQRVRESIFGGSPGVIMSPPRFGKPGPRRSFAPRRKK